MGKEDFNLYIDMFADVVANKVVEKLNLAYSESLAGKSRNENEYLNAQDICKQFHISKTTLYRHRDAGYLTPSLYVGRKPLFTKKDNEDYLKFFYHDGPSSFKIVH